MKGFFNYLKFCSYSVFYIFKHYNALDDETVRRWAFEVVKMFNIDVKVKGFIYDKRFVLLPNHESYFDIIALYVAIPQKLHWLAKKELFDIPFLGRALKKLNVSGINRNDPIDAAKGLIRLLKNFDEGGVVIFPEGSRRNKQLKDGGAVAAKKKKLPIYPVKIINTNKVMPAGKPVLYSHPVEVIVCEKIKPELDIDKIKQKVEDCLYG
ncbi:lysophospholipid acyltransferase family protein [Hippea jasoniae]|uniref:lysophospholipid acyltransferase family protein n=1 Tax=Hippea jasoniae TaxID=944479 RepID=UPI0006893CBA|nr:lysophospholipid acyltransferase family protein [Hippea jasoniae]